MSLTFVQPPAPFRPGGVVPVRLFDGSIPADMTVNHGPGKP